MAVIIGEVLEAMKQILENSGMFKGGFRLYPDFGGDINTFKPDFAKYNFCC